MTKPIPGTMLELRSLIKSSGELEITLARIPVPEPGPDEVLVQMQAAPMNPSDLGLLFGAADLTSADGGLHRRNDAVLAHRQEPGRGRTRRYDGIDLLSNRQ